MDFLVYRNHLGPVQIFTIPASGVPQTAYAPGGPFPPAMNAVSSKGSEPSWQDWAQHLTGGLPYHGSFAIQGVPDGLSPQQALGYVRQKEAADFLPP